MPPTSPSSGSGGKARRLHLLLLEDENEAKTQDLQLAKIVKLVGQINLPPTLGAPSPNIALVGLIKKTSIGLGRSRKRRKTRLKNIKNLFLQVLVELDQNGNRIN